VVILHPTEFAFTIGVNSSSLNLQYNEQA